VTTLVEIDREIRQLTSENALSRPFLCTGSPIGCDVAKVGINPATDTPFWPNWNVRLGCDKQGWLHDYPTFAKYMKTDDGMLKESVEGRRRGAFDISIWDPRFIATREHRKQKVLCAAELATGGLGC
jgi:hypothetical protein